MYENNNNARIQEKIQNFELVQNLIEEENKVDKRYIILLGEVKKWMAPLRVTHVLKQNMAKLKKNGEKQAKIELDKRKKKRNLLLEEKKKNDDGRKELKRRIRC
jgi:hypothetical protein